VGNPAGSGRTLGNGGRELGSPVGKTNGGGGEAASAEEAAEGRADGDGRELVGKGGRLFESSEGISDAG
jgi:hypothetical protein